MSEPVPVTTREAVLTSLLAPACLVILVLPFPNMFTWRGRSLFEAVDPNSPVPIQFLSQPPSQPPSATLGDAGRQKVSERRPADAPPPTNDDPYSRGNTRNR